MKPVGYQRVSFREDTRVLTVPNLGVFRQSKLVEFFDSDREVSRRAYQASLRAVEGRVFALLSIVRPHYLPSELNV